MRRKNARRFDPRYFMEEKTEKPKVLKEMQFGQKEMPADAYAEPVGTPPQRSLERRLQDLEDQIAGTRIPEQRKKLEKERAALKKKLGSGPVAEGHDGPAYASQFGSHLEDPSEMPEPDWINPLEQTVDKHDVAILHRMLADFFAEQNQMPSVDELQDLMSKAEKAQDRSRATHGQSESDPHWHFDRR